MSFYVLMFMIVFLRPLLPSSSKISAVPFTRRFSASTIVTLIKRTCRSASVYRESRCLSFGSERIVWSLYPTVVACIVASAQIKSASVDCFRSCCCPGAAFAVVSAQVSLAVEVSVIIVAFIVL